MEFVIDGCCRVKIVWVYNITVEILLVVIVRGNEISAGFHYRGWTLAIYCFSLTNLDEY